MGLWILIVEEEGVALRAASGSIALLLFLCVCQDTPITPFFGSLEKLLRVWQEDDIYII
jgi:hypothetical protein